MGSRIPYFWYFFPTTIWSGGFVRNRYLHCLDFCYYHVIVIIFILILDFDDDVERTEASLKGAFRPYFFMSVALRFTLTMLKISKGVNKKSLFSCKKRRKVRIKNHCF